MAAGRQIKLKYPRLDTSAPCVIVYGILFARIFSRIVFIVALQAIYQLDVQLKTNHPINKEATKFA